MCSIHTVRNLSMPVQGRSSLDWVYQASMLVWSVAFTSGLTIQGFHGGWISEFQPACRCGLPQSRLHQQSGRSCLASLAVQASASAGLWQLS